MTSDDFRMHDEELSAIESSAHTGLKGRRNTHTYTSAALVLRLTQEIRGLREEVARLQQENKRLLRRVKDGD